MKNVMNNEVQCGSRDVLVASDVRGWSLAGKLQECIHKSENSYARIRSFEIKILGMFMAKKRERESSYLYIHIHMNDFSREIFRPKLLSNCTFCAYESRCGENNGKTLSAAAAAAAVLCSLNGILYFCFKHFSFLLAHHSIAYTACCVLIAALTENVYIPRTNTKFK